MTRSHYLVGIDLGTTNCAVAYVDTHGRERPTADIRNFQVPQLVAPGETAPAADAAVVSLLAGRARASAGRGPPALERECRGRSSANLPACRVRRCPLASVSSAKSWLCHSGIDREAAILPWGSPPEVKKVSPVEASADYLRHIRDAWNDTFASDDDSSAARTARGRADGSGVV